MTYTILSSICLAILIAIFFYFLISYLSKDRNGRITFIRQFKKGKCAIIYLVAIPLYIMGFMFAGQDILRAIVNAFNKVMIIVVLRYDIGTIDALMNANIIYYITIYICYLLILLNAILFTLSFLQQSIWNFFKRLAFFNNKKEKLLIIGNNIQNINICKSEKNRTKIILANLSKTDEENLYRKNISYVNTSNYFKICQKVIQKCTKNKNHKYLFVINLNDDEKNIKLCNQITKMYKDIIFNKENPYTKEEIVDLFTRLRIYVFGNPAHETIYNDIVNHSYGSVRYINKYKKIASNFIKEHPFTQYMDKSHIDYNSGLLNPFTDINVAFIGFGKTNQQIFLTSVANNQFLTKNKEDDVILKPVNYHIFDKVHSENNKNLNYDYYRFKNEFIGQKSKSYLPLPSVPANETYNHLDVNDPSFFHSLKKIISSNNNDANFVIIAFGTDLENIDLAVKILGKKIEWNIKNLTVFVKVRSKFNSCSIFDRDDCFIIASEDKVVYNINEIDEDIITKMSKRRNQIYALEYELTSNPKKIINDKEIQEIFLNADYSWHVNLSQIERESNIYACLSLRSKLHLIGLDYVKDEKDNLIERLTEKEYMDIYAFNDNPKYINKSAITKKIIEYPLEFKDSKRKNLAIQEHYRWNSFMISKGIVPASKNDILNETITLNGRKKYTNGKSYIARRHGNLTTFDGLIEFRKLLAERDNVNEIVKDVIKYDYQLLDDAYWLLNDSGYAIIKKEK